MSVHLGVNGACGRMGQRMIQLAREDPELVIAAALEDPGHPLQEQDIGRVAGAGDVGVPVTSELALGCHLNVLIDFSLPQGIRLSPQ